MLSSQQYLKYRVHRANAEWSEGSQDEKKPQQAFEPVNALRITYKGPGSLRVGCTNSHKESSSCQLKENICQVGSTSGTSSLVSFNITLLNAPGYHIFYRCYENNRGWSKWKRDGHECSVDPYNKSHAIHNVHIALLFDEPRILYRGLFVTGWQPFVGDNQIVAYGDRSSNKVEAIMLQYHGPGRVALSVNVPGVGWKQEVGSNEIGGPSVGGGSGAAAVSKREGIEGVKIRLIDSEGYSVMYTVYTKARGWEPWARDGEECCTGATHKPIEGLRIRIKY